MGACPTSYRVRAARWLIQTHDGPCASRAGLHLSCIAAPGLQLDAAETKARAASEELTRVLREKDQRTTEFLEASRQLEIVRANNERQTRELDAARSIRRMGAVQHVTARQAIAALCLSPDRHRCGRGSMRQQDCCQPAGAQHRADAQGRCRKDNKELKQRIKGLLDQAEESRRAHDLATSELQVRLLPAASVAGAGAVP